MSERTLWILIFTVFFVLMIGATGFGLWQGNLHGRAQQKKEDADWYAAHPVVVHDYNPDGLPQSGPNPMVDVPAYHAPQPSKARKPRSKVKLEFWKDEDGSICREDHYGENGITCLNLEKPHDGICQGWGDIWWTNLPCPQYSKGWEGGPTGTITLPAEPASRGDLIFEPAQHHCWMGDGTTTTEVDCRTWEPFPKPINCEGIFLEGYGDQVHWASTSRNRY